MQGNLNDMRNRSCIFFPVKYRSNVGCMKCIGVKQEHNGLACVNESGFEENCRRICALNLF